MKWFRNVPPGDSLAVTMTGVKLGDRLLVIGCDPPKLVAQLALKPGLTGRACALDDNAARSARAAETALKEGALLESETAPYSSLPYDPATFDLVVVNHALSAVTPDKRVTLLTEARRVLRNGGRCIAIERIRRLALFSGATPPPDATIEQAFTRAGFRAVRTLAEREGMSFVEGAKRS